MPKADLISKAQQLADDLTARADEYTGLLGPLKEFIVETFGPNGLIAAYVLVSVVALLIVAKLAKITFSTLKFVVIPAVALAFLATFFIDVNFISALPITATACSLGLLIKG